MAGVRDHFVSTFGADAAEKIEAAANYHANGVNSKKKGDDPFKWALLICIGYDCCSKERFRQYHGISTPWEEIKGWIKEHGCLASHNGDCDYLALFGGAYNEFMLSDKADVPQPWKCE